MKKLLIVESPAKIKTISKFLGKEFRIMSTLGHIMDLPSRKRWYDYSNARDLMLKATDSKDSPWHIIRSDNKKKARLNCITHLLSLIPYKKLPRAKIKLPERSKKGAYDDAAALKGRKFVSEKY